MRYSSFWMLVLTIALAGAGYAYLRKRQPEYPNARVIATFTLVGGGLGGLLLVVPVAISDWWHGHYDNFYITISIGIMAGTTVGYMPATVCGLALAWGRSTRSWESAGFAAMVGGVASVLFTWLWTPNGVVVLYSLVGVLAAAILAALVLPKAE